MTLFSRSHHLEYVPETLLSRIVLFLFYNPYMINYWRGLYFSVSYVSRIYAKIKSSRIKGGLQYSRLKPPASPRVPKTFRRASFKSPKTFRRALKDAHPSTDTSTTLPLSYSSIRDLPVWRIKHVLPKPMVEGSIPIMGNPREDAGGFKSRIRPPYPQRVVKGD